MTLAALGRSDTMHTCHNQLHRQSSCRQHRRHSSVSVRAAGLSDVVPAAAAVILPIAGLAGWRLSLYSQLEVIRARMVGNYIPKNASVVQLNGSTKDLYYYPKTTNQVTVVGEQVAPGLFEQVGMNAGTPTRSRKQPCSDLAFIPDASVDAVVCLGAVAQAGQADKQQQVLSEACRVLKVGAPLIFIEPLADGASPLRSVIGAGGATGPIAAASLEDLLDQPALEVIQVDVALQGTDPHAVGVAKRTPVAAPRSNGQQGPDPEQAIRQSKRKGVKIADKGFK